MYNAMNRVYNVGSQKWTQDQLNNNMSGTDANAIYYATHGGSSSAPINSGNISWERPVVNPKPDGGGGNGGSGQASGGGADMNAYLSNLYAQRQAAAEEAYNKARGLLGDAYDRARGNYENIYNRGVDALGQSYNNSRGKINDQAIDAMRQAYINKMLSLKNLSQSLAAQGIAGGESESTRLGLENNYGNARNNIQKTWNSNLSDLELGYNTNLADLYNAYQERMAALDNSRAAQEAQLLSNLNNQIANVQGDYFSALASDPATIRSAISAAVGNISSIQPREQEVTNPFTPVNTQQVNDQGDVLTNYWRLAQQLDAQGASSDDITRELIRQGASNSDIARVLQSYFA